MSADQSVRELRAKCAAYRDRGIAVCWLINPEERWAEAWDGARAGERVAADEALTASELQGFALPLATLWTAIDTAPE